VKLSINVTNFDYPGGAGAVREILFELATDVDVAGLDTLWVSDHLLQVDPFADPAGAMLEGYTTLGFLAAATQRIRLGTMVTAATYRAPALLIKAVTTLDVLSGGRAWLGIGAGYHQAEAAAVGLFLPGVPERFARLEETLQLATQMWAGDPAPFHGHYLQLENPFSNPATITRPRPPILIGGTGPRRTLRLVAQYGDAANFFDIPDGGQRLRANLDALAQHCADIGRDPHDIEHTAEHLADRCRVLEDRGVDHVVLSPRGAPWQPHDAQRLGATVDLIA
jgi:F420-dependent oxidoreductase-like protein